MFRFSFFEPIFDEDKLLWLPFLTNFLDRPEDLSRIDDRIDLTLNSSLIEFFSYLNVKIIFLLHFSYNRKKPLFFNLLAKAMPFRVSFISDNFETAVTASAMDESSASPGFKLKYFQLSC